MNWSAIGAVALGLAVMLGAFGAHGMRGRVDAYSLEIFERAVFYHFIHALGVLVVPILSRTGFLTELDSARVCALLLAGIVVFCGTLYALAFTGIRILGAITPIGGVSFIAGWLFLAYFLFRGAGK